jgi:hypothetical protein
MEGDAMRWEGDVSWFDPEGRKHTGRYHVDKGMLHVSHGADSKRTQVGGHALNPKPLAEILLRELVVARAREDGSA